MSNIGGVGSANGAVMLNGVLQSSGTLDGETILAYCATQLNALGDEIKTRMGGQQASREAQKALADIKNVLARHPKGLNGANYEDKKAILEGYAKALNALPPNHPMRGSIEKSFEAFRKTGCFNNNAPSRPVDLATYGNDGMHYDLGFHNGKDVAATKHGANNENGLDETEVKAFTDDMSSFSDELNKNAELEMIGLQQLISQRQMCVQMSTNMMSKYSQGLEAIVANCGK